MSNRRTSSDRPRGWSQESGSSLEEVIVYQGNRMVKAPERQPTVPPTETHVQEDEGFAKFLKKHSSPTHQRVTAGGRIVPIEQGQRPPAFSLPQPNQGAEANHNVGAREEVNGIMNPNLVAQHQHQVGVADKNIFPLQPHPYKPVNSGVMEASEITAGPTVNAVPSTSPFAFDATRMQSACPQPVPYYAGNPGDPYAMMNHQMYPTSPMPFAGFNGRPGPILPPPYVHSPQMLGFPTSCGITNGPPGPQPQHSAYTQQMLTESIGLFEDLDRQLKALDRHRAMNERDPYLADQRMAIVTLRAEAKSQCSYWAETIGLDPKDIAKTSNGAPPSTLNVQTASYVPLGSQTSVETLSDNSASGSKPNGVESKGRKPDFVVDNTRRPIPIVPPPGKSPSPQKYAKGGDVSMVDSVEVDEWGVRVGPAPPEIQRQQSQMLEKLVRQASFSPLGSSDNAGVFTPQGSHTISPEEYGVENKKTQAAFETSSDSGEWLPTNPGRAPPDVEACYEVQLDAMRLQPGLTTKVRMPDGTITEVRGHGLQRPPSFEMDVFEQRYWTSKPTVTAEMFDNFVEVRESGGNKALVSIADILANQALNLERSVLNPRT